MTDNLVARARAAQRDIHRIEALTARAEAAEAERDALAAENNRLREALKPFADEAEHWESWVANEFLVEWFPEYDGNQNPITVGDLRNARAALKGQQP